MSEQEDQLSKALALQVTQRVEAGTWCVVALCGGRAVPEHVREWLKSDIGVDDPILAVVSETRPPV